MTPAASAALACILGLLVLNGVVWLAIWLQSRRQARRRRKAESLPLRIFDATCPCPPCSTHRRYFRGRP